MISRRRILACGAALALGVFVWMPGGARAQEVPASVLSSPVAFQMRDAPIREALEMLFIADKGQYVMDPGVGGQITLDRKQPSDYRSALNLLVRLAKPTLTYEIENGVYIVRFRRSERRIADAGPSPEQPGSGASPDAVSLPPLIRVERRVSGILQKEKGPAFAIIETGGRMPDRSVEVVQIGYRVDGGIAYLPQLTVESITATQVVLRARDKQAILVRLSDLAAPPATWQTWGTTQETKERKK